jgi:hypothetical protein
MGIACLPSKMKFLVVVRYSLVLPGIRDQMLISNYHKHVCKNNGVIYVVNPPAFTHTNELESKTAYYEGKYDK